MAITNNVLEFTLELTPGGIPPIIHASQGDVGRTFKANVVWNGSAASAYISGTTVKLRGKKPDKTVFDYSATLSGSAVTFATTEQMTILDGPVECELVFTSGSNVVASANFVLIVEDSPYNPDALSESDVTTLGDLIGDAVSDLDGKLNSIASFDESEITYNKSNSIENYSDYYTGNGYINSVGGIDVGGTGTTYTTRYIEVLQDMSIYVVEGGANTSYLSLAVYSGTPSIDNFSGRYRRNDSNLPTSSAPLAVTAGQWLAVSVGIVDTADFVLHTGIVTASDPVPTAEFLANIESGLTGTKLKVGTINKTASQIVVTVGKVRYTINKYADSSTRAFVWRTNNCDVLTDGGAYSRIWYNSDSDGVIKIKNEDDFLGGYHGDETQTNFKLFVDGVEYSENSTIDNMPYSEVVLFCASDIYHCNTSETPDVVAFKRNKIIIFNKDGYTVENYWTAQEAVSVIRAYFGMLSVERYKDNTYTEQILNGYYTNHDYLYRGAVENVGAQSDLTRVVFNTIYGDIGIEIDEIKTPASFWGDVTVYNSTTDKRLKAYLATINSNSGFSVSSGATIKARARIFYNG